MTELPFFVYGTLLPGEHNHDRFLKGRTSEERPAVLPDALLYEGPGYPYATGGDGTVRGALVTAAPGAYPELLALLDGLEQYLGPGHPRNLYERVARPALPMSPDSALTGPAGPVRAWVYLAAPAIVRSLAAGGTRIPTGDWLTRRPPPARRTP
ncbi:gamma-glutamylcyclotransferase family protein [Streptomyces sp. NPDC048301]|uniref:gamma-glutamylcyclotransferase family protein n=1 Tax=Streptomyces sp. NPDC048301 TaxID=3155631 RepID=UPI0034345410